MVMQARILKIPASFVVEPNAYYDLTLFVAFGSFHKARGAVRTKATVRIEALLLLQRFLEFSILPDQNIYI